MSRLAFPLVALICLAPATAAQDARPEAVEKALALQKAMAAGESYLTANQPADAVAVLETQLGNADGSRAFLGLLRRAYTAELKRLETTPNPDPARLAETRRKLALLGEPKPDELPPPTAPGRSGGSSGTPTDLPPAVPAVAPAANPFRPADPVPAAPSSDGTALLREARDLFKQGKYPEASAKFAAAVAKQAPVTQEEVAAWAYCRVRAAADTVNRPGCDPAAAAAAEKDVLEALQLAPANAELQKWGQTVLTAARQKSGPGGSKVPASPGRQPGESVTPADWEQIDTPSFKVRFKGTRDVAEAVAKAAEERRREIFERWSGPPAGPWQPRCEIVLHPTADCYAKMTNRPATGTGHAVVRLTNGRPSERKIELRADDPGAVDNALPRELTHVVLADLFPDRPPPKWAEEGMAVLAGSPDEVGRFVRTLPRCARAGQLFSLSALLEMKDFPAAEKITGFYCESVSVVEYLVKLGGERNFTVFLRDTQRYGTAAALKRTYGIDGPQALEAAWKRAALDTARGAGP